MLKTCGTALVECQCWIIKDLLAIKALFNNISCSITRALAEIVHEPAISGLFLVQL